MLEASGALGIVATVIVTAAYIPYIISILQKKTKPNRASWFIWAVLGAITFASYYSVGARSTLWYALPLGTIVTALLSIRYGVGGWNRFDGICLAGAFLGLILWGLSGNAFIALGMVMAIDLFAYLPTIRKTYFDPSSESRAAWALFFVSGLLNFMAIDSWRLEIAAYPAYMLLFNLIVFGLTLRKAGRKAKARGRRKVKG